MAAALRLVAVLCVVSSLASADPEPAHQPARRDETTALVLSTVATVAAAGLVVDAGNHTGSQWKPALAELGVAVALPSLARLYAGDDQLLGLGLRLGGAAGIIVGAWALDQPGVIVVSADQPPSRIGELAWFAVAGLAAMATADVYDIVTARRATRTWNATHGAAIAPIPMATPNGTALGLGVASTF
jgi:hypothetical protein